MSRTALIFTIPTLALALSACAPVPVTNQDAAGGSDAASPTDGGSTPGTEGGTPEPVMGSVGVGFWGDSMGQSPVISARRGARVPDCAPSATMGACRFFDCANPSEARPTIAVGDVTLSGGGMTSTVRPDAMNSYPLTETRFPAGSMVTVRVAGGGGVPALEGTVTMPTMSNNLAFAAPMTGATVDRSGDLVVDWMSEAYGNVRIVLANEGNARVVCDLPASAQRAVLPGALLMRMPTGSAQISAFQSSESTRVVSGWEFSVGVLRSVVAEGPRVELR